MPPSSRRRADGGGAAEASPRGAFREADAVAARLAGRPAGISGYGEGRVAAVVAPLVPAPGGISLLFQVRAATLRSQPGEVCFPGGKLEPGEAPSSAALRETREELGLPEGAVRLLAPLDLLVLPFNLVIHPYLGAIDDPAAMRPDPAEVAEVFTAPLSFFMGTEPARSPARVVIEAGREFPDILFPKRRPYGFREGRYDILRYDWRGFVIWGITARLVKSLVDALRGGGQSDASAKAAAAGSRSGTSGLPAAQGKATRRKRSS